MTSRQLDINCATSVSGNVLPLLSCDALLRAPKLDSCGVRSGTMTFTKLLARIAVLLTCTAVSLPCVAQYRARLFGTVTDATGAVVPGADLTLTDNETQRQLKATSGPDGNYSFNQLAPSSYKLEVTAAGFAPKRLDRLEMRAEQANAVNVVLEAGAASTTVTVEAQ